jgi:hypothetical protein
MEDLLRFALVSTVAVTSIALGAVVAWLSLEGMFHLMNKSQIRREPGERK